MLKAIIRIGLALLPAGAALAQTAADPTTFEVASVKPAAPQTPGRMMVGMRGGPGTPDPGQVTLTNVTQKMLLARAYGVQDYQISGPGWLESERYDIVAKVPEGATKEQFQAMLQNLLAERFKLTLHHETKELPQYALVVAKNGPKLKESAPPPAAEGTAAKDGAGPDGGPPPGPGPGFGPPPGEGGIDIVAGRPGASVYGHGAQCGGIQQGAEVPRLAQRIDQPKAAFGDCGGVIESCRLAFVDQHDAAESRFLTGGDHGGALRIGERGRHGQRGG